jgi:molybdopterin molybdotransferase
VGRDGLLSIEQALELVLDRVRPLPLEEVPIEHASGRVLGETVISRLDLPPFRSSAMDGFALRANDTPGTIPVVGQIAAGHPADRALEPGEAMAIWTGGVVPDGADAVVPIEEAEAVGGLVTIPSPATAGANVRPRGGDLRAGEPVAVAGIRLGPVQVGALAAAGVGAVSCRRRPRVVVAATGSELRAPGETLGPGEIYEANGLVLAGLAAGAGALVERLPSVADDDRSTRAAIARGLEGDVLVTSGGVSVGAHDLVRAAQAELGVEEVFWQVAVRPGKPVAFGIGGGTLVFGLPGNPVSSLVGFELFVRPALLALQGLADPAPRYRPGLLAAPVRRGGRTSLLRARSRVEDGAVVLEPLSGQESHMLARASTADALVLVPAGEGSLEAGELVRYLAL